MNTYDVLMPKLGESVQEATITNWFVELGSRVEEDTPLLEVATDKVDSEIPSPVEGVVKELRYAVDAVVPVGEVIAVIAIGDAEQGEAEEQGEQAEEQEEKTEGGVDAVSKENHPISDTQKERLSETKGKRFYSPLVKKIAKEHGLSHEELERIQGSGLNARVTKEDLLNYLAQSQELHKSSDKPLVETFKAPKETQGTSPSHPVGASSGQHVQVPMYDGDKRVPMDRMRKLIAEHMVHSKHTAAHVTSVIEVDLTPLVVWREKIKEDFLKKHGEKLTFMPFITHAVARALRDFPAINASVDGDHLILRKDVNIGIAVALPNGNLIVPVIQQADHKNIVGLSGSINSIAQKARENQLKPDDIEGGTFTITNFGSFKNIIGTPIINQPQVAILATGSIEKKVSVVETPTGDTIAIRHKMYLSLSYDHRVVDGMLGGMFLRRVGDYLEQFDSCDY